MSGGSAAEKQFRKEACLITKTIPKIRWYCGLCRKQFNSQVGFDKHCKHPEHLQKELCGITRVQRGKLIDYDVDPFSDKFKAAFVGFVKDLAPRILLAHDVYRKVVPNDRSMRRVQETCWGTLGRFVAYLREHGELRAFKTSHGWKVSVPQEQLDDTAGDAGGLPADQEGQQAPARPQRTAWNKIRAPSHKRRVEEDELQVAVKRAAMAAASSAARAPAGCPSAAGSSNSMPEEHLPVCIAGGAAASESVAECPSRRARVFFALTPRQTHGCGRVALLSRSRSGAGVRTKVSSAPPRSRGCARVKLPSPANTDARSSAADHERLQDEESEANWQQNWVRDGLVVKLLITPRCKARVESVRGGIARVVHLTGGHSAAASALDVAITDLQTVLPALGREVQLCGGPGSAHDGERGVLMAVHQARYSVDVRLFSSDELLTNVPYEGVCKTYGGCGNSA